MVGLAFALFLFLYWKHILFAYVLLVILVNVVRRSK